QQQRGAYGAIHTPDQRNSGDLPQRLARQAGGGQPYRNHRNRFHLFTRRRSRAKQRENLPSNLFVQQIASSYESGKNRAFSFITAAAARPLCLVHCFASLFCSSCSWCSSLLLLPQHLRSPALYSVLGLGVRLRIIFVKCFLCKFRAV